MKFNKKRNEKKKEERKNEVAESGGNNRWHAENDKIVNKLSDRAEKDASVLLFLGMNAPYLCTLVRKELQRRENARLAPKTDAVVVMDNGGEE